MLSVKHAFQVGDRVDVRRGNAKTGTGTVFALRPATPPLTHCPAYDVNFDRWGTCVAWDNEPGLAAVYGPQLAAKRRWILPEGAP